MSSDLLSAPALSTGVFTDTPSRDVAVSVRGLSKSYSIARNAVKHTSAGEAIMHKLRHPFEKVERDTFWALNDVNFDIQKGDVVGIIGRNGAGKSTLLKILSRITEPTKGRIDLYGRVGSLLEVGTGFHPELTGRENIYLNGAILGMQKSEITRQFDAIVEFAGVEQFLDTPVKRYSSGMYVRLAFAVAAHLNPEILIVDEVLAVGDAEFQKKCMGKMQDVANTGKTVLFVSHNMAAVQTLCNQAIYMQQGKICLQGTTPQVIQHYIEHGVLQTAEVAWGVKDAPGSDVTKIMGVRILDEDGQVSGEHFLRNSITLEMEYWCGRDGIRLDPSFHVNTSSGLNVFATGNLNNGTWGSKNHSPGFYRAKCRIPGHLLNDGQYLISAFVVQDAGRIEASAVETVTLQVIDDGSSRGEYMGIWIGVIRPSLEWSLENIS